MGTFCSAPPEPFQGDSSDVCKLTPGHVDKITLQKTPDDILPLILKGVPYFLEIQRILVNNKRFTEAHNSE